MMHGVPTRVFRRPEYLQAPVDMGPAPGSEALLPMDDVMLASAQMDQPGLVGTVKAQLDRLPPWVLYAAVGFGLIYASRRMR
jgi:hypothetical protein